MAGRFTIEHKTSDGELIKSLTSRREDETSEFAETMIEELEGDSGASVTVTWED